MLIDCDTCAGQGVHCGDCVISVLLSTPALRTAPEDAAPPGALEHGAPQRAHHHGIELDADEQVALVSLAEAGLVPPLRLATGAPRESRDTRGIA